MKWGDKELVVFDLECDGLLRECTKIYVISYRKVSEPDKVYSLTTYEEMIKFLTSDYYFIAHNGLTFDWLVAEKILGVQIPKTLIDSLYISWVITPDRDSHGLESIGESLGVQKPEIKDWKNLTIEEYKYRCEQDTLINTLLWVEQYKHLLEIYDTEKALIKFVNFLTFKGVCIQHQIKQGIKLNIDLCTTTLEKLEKEKKSKVIELASVMPKIPIKSIRTYPKIMTKKDGSISSIGQKWLDFLKEQNLPEDYNQPVEYITGWEEGNPGSHQQIKDWLYSLEWVPDNIQHKRDKKKNTIKQIPQIKHPINPGEVSDSVKALFDKEPKLKMLENLGILQHRISVFKSFLEEEHEGRVYAEIIGLTNTLRFQHKKPCVNLVSTSKLYGTEIRNSLISDDGYSFCAADISGAEDSTKRHFCYRFDPEYVKEQMVPGFDPHLKISVFAGYITEEEVEEYKILEKKENKEENEIKRFKYLKNIRQNSKVINFSSVYNIGVPALARQMKIQESEAKILLQKYWELNWSVKAFAESLREKTVRKQMWIQSPLNGFWLSCRKNSDKFSTCNQNAGSFLLDVWISFLMKENLFPIFQYQDEFLLQVKDDDVIETKTTILKCMKKVNNLLKLNVEIGCSVESGKEYGSVH